MQMTKSVKDPGKQRARLFNAPAHIRHKFMSAHLAPDLVKSQGVKSLPVRKGDTVRVVRGDHEGFEGKISTVDRKNYRIFLEGLTREKVDGTVIFVSVHPSKVLVKNLNLDDKWRKATLARKKPLPGKEEAEEKPSAKEAAKPVEAKVKPSEVKPKEPAKAKEAVKAKEETPVKPVVRKAKPAETKAVIPVEVEVEKKPEVVKEKPVEKKPRVAKKPVEKAVEKAVEKPAEQKPEAAAKPTRKRVVKEAAPAEEKPAKAKVTEEEKPAEKTTKAPAKRAAPKKAPAKSKPKTEKEAGGA